MKTMNLNQKHILFGVLLMTLGMTKSWFLTAPTSLEALELASTSQPKCEKKSISNGVVTYDCDIRIGTGSKGKSKTVKATVKDTKEKILVRDTNGTLIEQDGPSVTQASFNLDGCTQCIDVRVIKDSELTNLQSILQEHLSAQAAKLAQEEKQKEKNEKDRKKCLKDEDGESLTKRDRIADRLKCIIDRAEEDDDKSEREQFRQFKSQIAGIDLKSLLLSTNPEDQELLQQVLELSANNEYISDYFIGLGSVRFQHESLMDMAGKLATPATSVSGQIEQMQTRQMLGNLSYLLNSQEVPLDARSAGARAAFNDFRQVLAQNTNSVIQNPRSILQSPNSPLGPISQQSLACDPDVRGCRQPSFLNRNNLRSVSPMTMNNGVGTQGLYDPTGMNSMNFNNGNAPMNQIAWGQNQGMMMQGQPMVQNFNSAPIYIPGGVQAAPVPNPYNYNNFSQMPSTNWSQMHQGQNFAQNGRLQLVRR
jgi:hypothetical protein